jgi:hypothetical protein
MSAFLYFLETRDEDREGKKRRRRRERQGAQ